MPNREHNPLFQTLQSLVAIPSEYPNEHNVTQFLLAWLDEHHFGTVTTQEVAPGRNNILITRGSGDKAILFYGHVDTVRVVDGWTHNPFELHPDGDRLYGLGAYDMKGGIAAFLRACQESDTYIKIMLVVDEEDLSRGAWHMVHHSPSFFTDVELAISAEPNFGLGLHGITTGRTGRVVYDLNAAGQSAHLTRLEDGIDSIANLASFICAFYTQRDQLLSSAQSKGLVRMLHAEAAGMSVCDEAQAQVDLLLAKPDTVGGILSKLQELSTTVEVTLHARPTPFLEGYHFDSFPHQDIVADIVQETTGQMATWEFRSSVADDNVIASLSIPVITWGPDGANAHASDEWVSWESLKTLSLMYEKLLKRVRK
ncbi:MAG: M20/M25/M40 family metallo-hydrolase [Candidatus Woesebacteria bacterium]